MQSLPDMYRQVEKMKVQDLPWFYNNEITGYRFRDSNGQLDAAIAQNSNGALAFYSPSDTEENSGFYRWFNGNVERQIVATLDTDGNFECLSDVTAFKTNLSDARFKSDIEPYVDWEATLSAIRPVSFTWSAEAPVPSMKGMNDIGLIAQEVAETYPLAHDVKTLNGEEVHIVRYEKFIPLLLAAVQSHQKRIDELEEKLKAFSCGCQ